MTTQKSSKDDDIQVNALPTTQLTARDAAPNVDTTATGMATNATAMDVEAKGSTVVTTEEELYSVFSKKQKLFIAIMVTFGAVISPISGAI